MGGREVVLLGNTILGRKDADNFKTGETARETAIIQNNIAKEFQNEKCMYLSTK